MAKKLTKYVFIVDVREVNGVTLDRLERYVKESMLTGSYLLDLDDPMFGITRQDIKVTRVERSKIQV